MLPSPCQDAALCTEQGGKWVNLNQNFDNLLVAFASESAKSAESAAECSEKCLCSLYLLGNSL
jgi:hypothetical protein